jgi:hypothetical protein
MSKARFGRWDCPFRAGQVVPVSQVCDMSLHVHAVLPGQPLGGNSQSALTLSVDLQFRLSAASLHANASSIPEDSPGQR